PYKGLRARPDGGHVHPPQRDAVVRLITARLLGSTIRNYTAIRTAAGLTRRLAKRGPLMRQNAYQHFRKQAPPALYRTGKSCSNWCKSAGLNRPENQGERPS